MQPQPALTAAERQALEHFKIALQSLLGDNLLSLRLFGSRARAAKERRSRTWTCWC